MYVLMGIRLIDIHNICTHTNMSANFRKYSWFLNYSLKMPVSTVVVQWDIF